MNNEIKTKQITLRLDPEIYEAFFRIFPKHGQRQYFLRAAVREVINQIRKEPNLIRLPEAVRTVLTSAGMKVRLGTD